MVDSSNSYKDRVSRLISWGHWFMFANILLAVPIASRYIFAVDGQFTFISTLYVLASLLGHFSLLGILCYISLLFPVTFIIPYSKILRGLAATVATFIILFLLIDSSIYQSYQLHFNILALDLKGFNFDHNIGWGFVSFFVIGLLIIELTLANLIWKRLHVIRQWHVGNKLSAMLVGLFLLSHLIHIWADTVVYKPVLSFDRMFPFTQQSTARSFMKKLGWIDVDHQQQINLNRSPDKVNYPLQPLQCQPEVVKNLLFITIDTANADLLTPTVMPNLYALSQTGLSATAHITSSMSASDARFSRYHGIPAIYKPAIKQQLLTSPFISLTANSTRKTIGRQSTLTGHDSAYDIDSKHVNDLISWINNQANHQYFADITLYASQQLNIGQQPLLQFPHAMPTFGNAPEYILANQYINSLYYTDQLIGQLLASVDLTRTTVVVTANRGADLKRLYRNAQFNYSQINLHVPLVITGPDFGVQSITKLSSHYDVLPTLLNHHFNCGNPASDISVGHALTSTQSSALLYLGDGEHFSLYQRHAITEIDRQGQYRFFDNSYIRQPKGELSFVSLIELMSNIQRFNHK